VVAASWRGTASIVWKETGDDTPLQLRQFRPETGGFMAPHDLVTGPADEVDSPTVVVDGDGAVTVAWLRRGAVEVAQFKSAGTRLPFPGGEEVVRVSAEGRSQPRLAVDRDGTVTVAWWHVPMVEVRQIEGGSRALVPADGPRVVTTGATKDFAMGVTPDGLVTTAWTAWGTNPEWGDVVAYSQFDTDALKQPPPHPRYDLATTESEALVRNLNVTADRGGAIVSWTREDPGERFAIEARRVDTARQLTPEDAQWQVVTTDHLAGNGAVTLPGGATLLSWVSRGDVRVRPYVAAATGGPDPVEEPPEEPPPSPSPSPSPSPQSSSPPSPSPSPQSSPSPGEEPAQEPASPPASPGSTAPPLASEKGSSRTESLTPPASSEGTAPPSAASPPPVDSGRSGETSSRSRVSSPQIRRFGISPQRFRASVSSKSAATFSYALDRPARLSIAFEQQVPGIRLARSGKRSGKTTRCVPSTETTRKALSRQIAARSDVRRRSGRSRERRVRELTRQSACTTWSAMPQKLSASAAAPEGSLPFSGRVGKNRLQPGEYRAVATALADGHASEPRVVTFTVLEPRPKRR
jgi:hypothetical protein